MTIDEAELKNLYDRHTDKRLVLAIGTFDIVHPGHIEYLAFSKQQGDILVVALPNDKAVRQQKGEGRPVFDITSRISVVENLKPVDYTVGIEGPYSGLTEVVAKVLNPEVIVVYMDWPVDDIQRLKQAVHPARVIIYKNVKKYSSSAILKKLTLLQ